MRIILIIIIFFNIIKRNKFISIQILLNDKKFFKNKNLKKNIKILYIIYKKNNILKI